MMRFLQRSLTTKLVTLFGLLAILPLVVVGYLAYDSGRRSIVSNVEAHLESVVILKEQEIKSWVHHLEHTVTWLAANPQTRADAAAVIAHTAGDPAHVAAHDSLVAEFKRITDLQHVSHVFLLDASSGQIIASSDPGWEGQFRETEHWFIGGKTGGYVSDILHSLALGRPTMVIAAPVTDDEGQLLAVLAGHANLEGLSEVMLERSGLGKTGETYLVNQGNLLLTDLRFEPGAAFKRWVFTEGVSRALAGKSGVGLYLDYREEPVIGAYHWLEDRDMALLAEVDQTEAFAPIAALRNTVLGVGVGVALTVALLGTVFARTITGPVRQLARGAEEIGRGNLDHRIQVQTQDEIGRLAGAFNDMAANLRRSLGETAWGQRLLLALSQAAQEVQRVYTPAEIYRTVGKEVSALGYHAMIFTLTEDRAHLQTAHVTFDSDLMRTAEKLTGLSARSFRVAVEPGGFHDRVMTEGQTLFVKSMAEHITETLPSLARPLAERVANMMGLGQGIYAPLKAGEQAQGILAVTGADLTEADVAAVNAFANQTAIALENAQLYQEVQHHAEDLERRVAERTAELDDARIAALNMMEDADEARRQAERANEDLQREIEERKRVEAELERSNTDLEQFAYVASHDLQEPLRKVQAFGNRLASKYAPALNDRGRDYLERMQDAARRGQVMINDLLNFSRVSTRGQPFETVDLRQVVEVVISDLEIRIQQSGGQVEVDALPTIEADRTQMRQLLGNLIGNALKFHREGIAPVVEVTSRRIDDQGADECQILVKDNGIGFDEKYLDRLFQPFQRLHGRGTYEGTGIGLAICRKIAERHGGSITARTTPGQGATFAVTLPVQQDNQGNADCSNPRE